MSRLRITPTLSIGMDEITERFVTASGPGGQNVNKVATAVELRFNAAASPSLPHDMKLRLARIAGRAMTQAGILVIDAQRFRSQLRNREDALDRLRDLLMEAAHIPKARRPTRPSYGSHLRRLEAKGARSDIHTNRRRPGDE